MAPKVPRRRRFKPERRTRLSGAPGVEDEATTDGHQTVQGLAAVDQAPLLTVPEEHQLESIAADLWVGSYSALFSAEMATNARLLGRGDGSTATVHVRSSYRARLRGEKAIEYDRKQLRRERDQMAIELHGANMRFWSPSLVARSISYFNLTTNWQHRVESGQRRLASPPTTLKVLRLMRDARPKPCWEEGHHVFAFIFDQTYEWVGMAKRGRRQALERVDAARP